MPKYRFSAIDSNNKKVRGTFIANNDKEFKKIMNHQDYYLLSYRREAESSTLFGFLDTIRTKDFVLFVRQFSIMLNSGMKVIDVVSFLIRNTKNQKLKKVLEGVHNDLLQGKSLSAAFGRYPNTFPQFFRNMVKIGEESGGLSQVLNKLADYYEKLAEQKKKVRQAFAYPIFLVIISIAAILFLSMYVMPKFEKVFAQFDGELPLSTRIVLGISNFLLEYYGFVFAGVLILGLIIMLLNRSKEVKRIKDRFKLLNPLTKNLHTAVITSRFANGFSVLISNGVKLIDSIDTMSKLLDNMFVEKRLQVVKREIESGNSIAKSLNVINVFPKMLIEMIEVGEETTSLEQVLDISTKYFEDDVETQIKAMTASIQPILLGILALLIMLILLAIFQPMLDLLGVIERSA